MTIFSIFIALLWLGLGIGIGRAITRTLPNQKLKYAYYFNCILLAPFIIGYIFPEIAELIGSRKDDK